MNGESVEKRESDSPLFFTLQEDDSVMIVMKFGGSSLASAAAVQWVAGIVKSHEHERPVVVVSAMGKTTDRLQEALDYAAQGSAYSAWRRLEDLRLFHFQETQRLLGSRARKFLDERIAPLFRELHGLLIQIEEGRKPTPELTDEVLSYGERLSSEIMAAALEQVGIKTTHVNSCEVIVTDDHFTQAAPLYWETYAQLRRTVAICARNSVVVMGGFIGATRVGEVTTLGRGGSDLTASLVGAGVSASEIQIWTDVDGMLSCDPRVLHGGYRLRSIGYEEAEEMARLGAKVLCPNTVAPAVRQGIPIVIRNSRRPEAEGTIVSPQALRKSGVVKSVAAKTGMTVIHLFVPHTGILRSITEGLSDLLERNQVRVEFVQAQPDGVSFAVQSSVHLPELIRQIDSSVRISVEENSAIVSLVGDGIGSDASLTRRAMTAILKDTGIRMNSQGFSPRSISFAVAESRLAVTVENLHREFFRAPDPEIFAVADGERRPVGRIEDLAAAEAPLHSQLGSLAY
jgi:aspartate kinase